MGDIGPCDEECSMELKTYQARCYSASAGSRFVTRLSFGLATMLLAGLTVVGSGTNAGVGNLPETQIVQQILTVQGQDLLASAKLAPKMDTVPTVSATSSYSNAQTAPMLVGMVAKTGHGIDPTVRMAERSLHVAGLTETSATPKRRGRAQWQCLAEALYFEARSESLEGQRAVAEVILNRVDSRKFPNTVCEVITQGAHRRNACQFSYNCDGRPERITEPRAFERAKKIALDMVGDRERTLTDGATHYHTSAVNPRWARKLTRTAKIGTHIFYSDNTVLSRR